MCPQTVEEGDIRLRNPDLRGQGRLVHTTRPAPDRSICITRSAQVHDPFVERINLTIRQHVAAVGRRVSTLCKGEDGLRQQLAVFHCYYNFCLPHASVRQPLPQPEPINGTGSATQWRPCTPAMAAGLTDRVWTLKEVLLCRVPPWPQPQVG